MSATTCNLAPVKSGLPLHVVFLEDGFKYESLRDAFCLALIVFKRDTSTAFKSVFSA